MQLPTASIIRAATRSGKLNVLTCPTHERYAGNMSGVSHTFYLYRAQGIKDWNFKYGALPPNHILLNPDRGHNQIPPHIDIDICLSQNTVGQYQVLRQFSDEAQLPLISLEHCIVTPGISQDHVRHRKANLRADLHVFISEVSANEWGYDLEKDKNVVVLHHGVDTDLFKPSGEERINYVMVCANDFVNRGKILGYQQFVEATKGLPVKVLGETPGLSRAANDLSDLISHYQRSQIFLNTSIYSPIPSVVLEAAACECAIVTTDHCMLKEIFTHEYDCYFANDSATMRKYLKHLLINEADARRIGSAARETIKNLFPLDKFIQSWQNVLTRAIQIKEQG